MSKNVFENSLDSEDLEVVDLETAEDVYDSISYVRWAAISEEGSGELDYRDVIEYLIEEDPRDFQSQSVREYLDSQRKDIGHILNHIDELDLFDETSKEWESTYWNTGHQPEDWKTISSDLAYIHENFDYQRSESSSDWRAFNPGGGDPDIDKIPRNN